MIPARVSLITIGAYELPTLRRFYQSLGWAETEISSDTYAVFRTAGVLLSIFPIEELYKDANLSEVKPIPEFRGVTLAINLDKREDVDLVIEEVRKRGGRIVKEPEDAFWGGRSAYFMDPENNAWEVAWNPTAVFNEYGAMTSF
ncbi:VOC family protein [Cohnella sp. AR92]|uniref:VOC family protein n=1 Tax=Cohnella sp. AR92 TaxID=648716 RepID=UPI000F8C596A|nr:VOC family protein [Cohnella sp. AR92]RUS45819.1 glyoxalase [Cohnella sp. AR92]